MTTRKVIPYTCEGCGREFESRIRRPEGNRYCGPCTGKLRNAGLGPRQTGGIKNLERMRQVLTSAQGDAGPRQPKQQAEVQPTEVQFLPEGYPHGTIELGNASGLTIENSILEPIFVDIGRARVGKVYEGLLTRLGGKISDYQKNIQSPHSGSQLNLAAKAAVEMGWSLEFSWAAFESNTIATAHEAALIRCYKTVHGRLPGFVCPDNGKFIKGLRVTPSDKGPVGLLMWSPWKPMQNRYIEDLPKKPGVYRIRAMPPG